MTHDQYESCFCGGQAFVYIEVQGESPFAQGNSNSVYCVHCRRQWVSYWDREYGFELRQRPLYFTEQTVPWDDVKSIIRHSREFNNTRVERPSSLLGMLDSML